MEKQAQQPQSQETEEPDIFRDTWLRYLGYTNECSASRVCVCVCMCLCLVCLVCACFDLATANGAFCNDLLLIFFFLLLPRFFLLARSLIPVLRCSFPGLHALSQNEEKEQALRQLPWPLSLVEPFLSEPTVDATVVCCS